MPHGIHPAVFCGEGYLEAIESENILCKDGVLNAVAEEMENESKLLLTIEGFVFIDLEGRCSCPGFSDVSPNGIIRFWISIAGLVCCLGYPFAKKRLQNFIC